MMLTETTKLAGIASRLSLTGWIRMMLNIYEYLEQSAARAPEKVAFSDETESVTFRELLRRTQVLGAHIAETVGEINRPIGVLTDRTVSTLVAFFAVVASGNYYVPIDDGMPRERLRSILTQVSPPLVLNPLAHSKGTQYLEGLYPIIGCADIPPGEGGSPQLLSQLRHKVLDIDPLYTIFTSGSTGAPKGIVISHRSVIDFTDWMAETCKFSDTDVMGNQAPFYFDLSVKDIYLTLKCGASTHILPKKLFLFPLLLLQEIEKKEITALVWATSAFNLVANSGALERVQPEKLNKVIVGGEALHAKRLNLWRRALPQVQYTNLYGPTEVTVDCTWFPIRRDYGDDEPIPIGYPCRNMDILLLDEQLHLTAPGQPGEICVRGTGLAKGYFGDWDKTRAAFIQNPLNPHYPDILYRTGDLAVSNEEGLLVFLTRRDGQIKHMGYRIELGEVESALLAQPEVAEAVCFFDRERDKIICCYVSRLERNLLARSMRDVLPSYMLPNVWISYDALPYNANGKIDRVKLREDYVSSNS